MVWESVWDPKQRCFYYWDRTTGKAVWNRPRDAEPPKKKDPGAQEVPDPPEGVKKHLPPGWIMEYDRSGKTNRWYYYKKNDPEETRTWLKPPREDDQELKDEEALTESMSKSNLTNVTKMFRKRSLSKNLDETSYGNLTKTFWDAGAYAERLKEANEDLGVAFRGELRAKVLKEVCKHNEGLVSVPRTFVQRWDPRWDDPRFLNDLDLGTMPTVSFLQMGLADACSAILSTTTGKKKRLCCISPASGLKPGGNYMEGGAGVEEELCRRVPAFYSSLNSVRRKSRSSISGVSSGQGSDAASFPAYPFGLAANQKEVLFTPGLILVRGKEEEGFPILPASDQVVFSVVSVAAMPKDVAEDSARKEDVYQTISAMLLAPVVDREPRADTLVIGPIWIDADGGNQKHIAEMLAATICTGSKGPGETKKGIGRFYNEIHFVVPPRADGEKEDILKLLKATMKAHGIMSRAETRVLASQIADD